VCSLLGRHRRRPAVDGCQVVGAGVSGNPAAVMRPNGLKNQRGRLRDMAAEMAGGD